MNRIRMVPSFFIDHIFQERQGASMRPFAVPVVLSFILLLATQSIQAQTKKVTLTTLNWEPYIGEALPGKGYVYEIVSEAFQSVGYQVEIRFSPWPRTVAEAESGKADGLFPEYYDENRRAHFVYSKPFPGGPVGFLARKESKITFPADPQKDLAKTLRGMKQYSFGVVRDYINTKEFDDAAYLLKDESISDEQNIQKLILKRTDLIYIDKLVAQHLIKTKFLKFSNELEFLEPPLEVKTLYIAFSKKAPDYEEKLIDFNEGLAKLQKAGAIKAIMKKYGF
jgi:polar amino acid transport system substrate-binding protein